MGHPRRHPAEQSARAAVPALTVPCRPLPALYPGFASGLTCPDHVSLKSIPANAQTPPRLLSCTQMLKLKRREHVEWKHVELVDGPSRR